MTSLHGRLAACAAFALAACSMGIDVAQVPESLKNDPAYSTYAKILVQLDLLANPQTASLPITVDSPLPGVIDLRGGAPSSLVKAILVQNAQRISGLRVRETLRIVNERSELDKPFDPKQRKNLENGVRTTLAQLFPELGDKLRVSASNAGVVTLSGDAPTYESKLMLSQTAKSQPMCKAVVNQMTVPTYSSTQKILVKDDGSEMLFAAQLPTVPAAAKMTPVSEDGMDRGAGFRAAADDAPVLNQGDQQTADAVRARFESDRELAPLRFEVEVQKGVVTISGTARTRSQVELAVATASETPHVTKVVAKCRPVSIQRNRAMGYDAAKNAVVPAALPEPPKPRKLFGFIPLPGTTSSEASPAPAPITNKRYREALKKTIGKRCGADIVDLNLKAAADGSGLIIEGQVENPQRRAAVFKQIDNLAELRGVNYDVVLNIRDGE